MTIQSTFDETEENDFDEIDTQTLSILINLRDLRKLKMKILKLFVNCLTLTTMI